MQRCFDADLDNMVTILNASLGSKHLLLIRATPFLIIAIVHGTGVRAQLYPLQTKLGIPIAVECPTIK